MLRVRRSAGRQRRKRLAKPGRRCALGGQGLAGWLWGSLWEAPMQPPIEAAEAKIAHHAKQKHLFLYRHGKLYKLSSCRCVAFA